MINKVTLIGRLTKDVDLKFTQSGKAVGSFNLAVNRNFKNQSGETEADFINCVVWDKKAETLANYTKKGSLLGVVGSIRTRNYENQQGQRVYVTEVLVDEYQFLDSRNDNQQSNQSNNHQQQNSQTQQISQSNYQQQPMDGMGQFGNPFNNGSQIKIEDDDLPF